MPNTIGSLVIDLVANTASFATQLNGAVKSVEDTVSKIKTAFGGLGAIFSIASIADLTKDALSFGDELQKATAKTGLQATAISQLAFAAKQANIDLPELVSTFDKMEKSISSATTGTGTSKTAFDALGISLAQLKSLTPDQQFEEIANQINKLTDPTDKARAAVEIFGRAGADLLPLFEQGAAGIEEARQKAVDFGASLDSEQVAKLATANTAVKDLGASFSALATTLVGKVAPGIAGFFDSITNAVTDNKPALLTKQIQMLQEQLDYVQASPGGGGPIEQELQAQIAKAQIALQGAQLAKQISDSLAKSGDIADNAAPGFLPDIQPVDVTAQKIQIGAMAKFYQDLDDATKTGGEKLLDDTAKMQAQLDLLVKDGIISLGDSFNRIDAGDNSQALSEFFTSNAASIQSQIKSMQEGIAASFASNSAASKLSAENMKKDFDATANFAVEAGKSIQDSFAEAFDDIGTKGLGGLVSDFINAFRKILDQAAAFDLAKALGITTAFQNQGSGSAVGSIFSGFGSLFGFGSTPSSTDSSTAATIGFATGGSFNVGGTGGTDSQLVQFKATPGEMVSVSTPGQAAGQAIHFAPVYNVGSGVSRSDVISACAATQRATISEMTRLIRGGAYA